MNTASHPSVQRFLEQVCSQIRCKEVHGEIRAELLSHLEEIVECETESRRDLEESIAHAIESMGEPALVGQQLHRIHRPRMEWTLFGSVLALLAIGLLMMYGFDTSGTERLNGSDYLYKQALGIGAGLLAGVFLVFWDFGNCSAIRIFYTLV